MANSLDVASPNGNIVFTISDEKLAELDEEFVRYWVTYDRNPVINASKLGMTFKNGVEDFGKGFKISGSDRSSVNSVWEQPWGERRYVEDHHNELRVDFSGPSGQFSVRIRVFDYGIGFRYEVPAQAGLSGLVEIADEHTEFAVEGGRQTTAWWTPRRGIGNPYYEQLTRVTPLTDIDWAHTPLTMRLPNGTYISIHEAALVDYSGMSLGIHDVGKLKADLASWHDGVKVKTEAPFNSPWRTIQISDDAVGLLNSTDLILNLNEPNKLGDVSWVKPGKYIGIWWGMHLNKFTWGSGPNHGATTERAKQYMDFASKYSKDTKYGFDGVLVEGWNVGWDGKWWGNGEDFDQTQAHPDFDIEAVADYGASLNPPVKLIGHHETGGCSFCNDAQMDDAYDYYKALGVAQVKTGYVSVDIGNKVYDEQGIVRFEGQDSQPMVERYLTSVIKASEREISINTHEPVKDTGLRRTYPNWIAREGARGQEYNSAWEGPINPPEHIPMLAFTRLLAGPMDFTPGIFEQTYALQTRGEIRPKTTRAKQLAEYVVIYSPIQMAADLPENYVDANGDPLPGFQFIIDVPTDWEESIGIAGEVGDYVVMARKERGGSDWYLGALTDENRRHLKVPLNFLTDNKKYIAEIYSDGAGADYERDPSGLMITEKSVKRGDVLNLQLARSGGAAIRFREDTVHDKQNRH
jgi:alpha-glucosidase